MERPKFRKLRKKWRRKASKSSARQRELLDRVDAVLMTCIDGNRHLELAIPVLRDKK
jgi:hypothetical protein